MEKERKIDRNKEGGEKVSQPGEPAISSSLQTQDRNSPSSFRSWGMVAHNELTYRVVDLFLNSIVAVGFAYWSKRTAGGQKYFGEPVAKCFKAIIRPFTKSPETLEQGAKWGSMFASIMVGGTAIIPVMMGLEKKSTKKAIVKWVDEKIYGKEEVESDPKFKDAYKTIDEEPKKDFVTGMIARMTVLAPLILMTITPALNNKCIKYLYDPIAKGTKFLAKSAGIKPKKMLKVGADGQTNWDFLHRTIGFDFGLTFFYSFLHEYAYKKFAGIERDMYPEENNNLHAAPVVEMTSMSDKKLDISGTKHSSRIIPKSNSFVTNIAAERPAAQVAI